MIWSGMFKFSSIFISNHDVNKAGSGRIKDWHTTDVSGLLTCIILFFKLIIWNKSSI